MSQLDTKPNDRGCCEHGLLNSLEMGGGGGGGGGGGDDPWELCKCSIFTPNTDYILLSLGQLMLCQQLCTGVMHHLKWEAPSESMPHFKEAGASSELE